MNVSYYEISKNIITMRFSHFLGNVIGYVWYFSLLGILRIFAPRGYFRKKHMGRREGLSLSTAYWLNYTLYTCDKILNTFSYTNFVSVLRVYILNMSLDIKHVLESANILYVMAC